MLDDDVNDTFEIDPKLGKKKQLKLQAKEEKRQQREVGFLELNFSEIIFIFFRVARSC